MVQLLPILNMYITDTVIPPAIGRKAQVYSRVQGIKATVWLSEEYPLSLQDQILPIIELMVIYTV